VVVIEEAHNFITSLHNKSINTTFIIKRLMNSNCKIMLLSGTPIVSASQELAIITNICKSKLDGRRAPSCSIFSTSKHSLDNLSDLYITNRLYGIIAYSEGVNTDYPELYPLKLVYCDFDEQERAQLYVIMAELGKKNLNVITIKDTALIAMSFCKDKIHKILSFIEHNSESKHIIYTNYTTFVIPKMEEALKSISFPVHTISGAVTFDE
jgi:hypothetical protein